MNNNNTQPKTVTLKVSHIRDVAIVLACVAVGYSFLTKPGQPSLQPGNDVVTISGAPAAPQSMSQDKAGEGLSIKNGALTLGDDEISNRFRKFLRDRIAQVNAEGPVALKSSHLAQPETHTYSPMASASDQPLRVAQSESPVVRSDVRQENASTTTEKGTLHPAPFTDKAAQSAIDEISQQVIARKGTGVVQIGRHLDGSMMTESQTEEQIRRTLSNIPDEWTITYKSPNEKVRLYVFTDTTCPFCHKLHAAMPELLNAGISVHYLLYPRDMGATQPGMLSRTAVNMKNIWCAVDQKSAMDDAFEGYKVPEADCSTLPASLNRRPAPVPDHFLAGSMFNVEATPTWLASNGKHDVGFTNAQTMIRTLLGN